MEETEMLQEIRNRLIDIEDDISCLKTEYAKVVHLGELLYKTNSILEELTTSIQFFTICSLDKDYWKNTGNMTSLQELKIALRNFNSKE